MRRKTVNSTKSRWAETPEEQRQVCEACAPSSHHGPWPLMGGCHPASPPPPSWLAFPKPRQPTRGEASVRRCCYPKSGRLAMPWMKAPGGRRCRPEGLPGGVVSVKPLPWLLQLTCAGAVRAAWVTGPSRKLVVYKGDEVGVEVDARLLYPQLLSHSDPSLQLPLLFHSFFQRYLIPPPYYPSRKKDPD